MLFHLLCPGLCPPWTKMLHGSQSTGITTPGQSSCCPVWDYVWRSWQHVPQEEECAGERDHRGVGRVSDGFVPLLLS